MVSLTDSKARDRDKHGIHAKSCLALAELYIEVKRNADAFKDPPSDLHDREAIESHNFIDIGGFVAGYSINDPGNTAAQNSARLILGQNVTYAAEAFDRQHRIFYFSLFIVGTKARFIRWDRSGAIVSRAFDYKSSPEILCKFLWRFGLADARQRGYDSSAFIATREEEDLFKRLIRRQVAFQLDINEISEENRLDEALEEHYGEGRVTKLYLHDRHKNARFHFLVSRPSYSPLSLAGGATREYWCVKLDDDGNHQVLSIKDSWRTVAINLCPEGDMYRELNKKDMNIPSLFCDGDIYDEDSDGDEEEPVGEVDDATSGPSVTSAAQVVHDTTAGIGGDRASIGSDIENGTCIVGSETTQETCQSVSVHKTAKVTESLRERKPSLSDGDCVFAGNSTCSFLLIFAHSH